MNSTTSTTKRVFLAQVRPVEWVVLAFVLFVVGRSGLQAFSALTGAVVGRAELLVLVLALVGEAVLVRKLVATKWVNDRSPMRRRLSLTLPLVLTPMAVMFALVVLFAPSTTEHADSGRAFLILSTVVHAVALSSPPFALWAAVSLEARRRETFSWRAFVRWAGPQLLDVARDWLPLVVLISGYSWMGAVMDLTPVSPADATLAGLDRAIFGVDPIEALQRFITPGRSEFLAFSYAFYAVLFPVTFGALELTASRAAFRQTAFAVCLGLALAYVSYTLVPAKGPVLTRQFDVPLDLFYVAGIKAALMDASRITWDCFPSMHTALTVVMLTSLARYSRRVFWVVLPVAGPIPFACLYLRYHYVVDVVAGALFAVALIAVASRVTRATG